MRKRSLASLFLLAASLMCFAQDKRIATLEFRDQPIADILLALGEAGQISIVPDASITGSASYYFADMAIDAALKKFAASFNLYITLKDGVYYISKIDARYEAVSGLASLHAEEVPLPLVIRMFSKAIGKTILHDELPDKAVTIHVDSMPPQTIVEILSRSIPGISLEKSDSYFFLHRTDVSKGTTTAPGRAMSLVKNGTMYSLDAVKASYLDLVAGLFSYAGKDYSILARNDTIIDGLRFKDRSFEEALSLILEQANADYTIAGNVYYVFEIQKKDVLKKLKATVALSIENFAASDVIALLPPDFATSGTLRLDKTANVIYLSGSLEEISPIQTFIRQIDVPVQGKSYVRIDLKYLKAKDIIPVLPARFSAFSPIALPDGSGFVVLLSDSAKMDLENYVELVDRASVSAPIKLRYIKAEDVLKNLPPSVTKENIIDGGNGSVIFFIGSETKKRAFLEDLAMLDRPKAQIRYDILVVQYTVGDNLDYSGNLTVSADDSTSTTPLAIVADLSKLLNLRLDVLSEFGYLFSATLDANLEDDRAQIFADTTLSGVVGRDLKFQNTTTYRYKDTVTDSSGNTTSAVTREVTSGLILVLNGWASGDGMITVDISVTASERTDTSSNATTAPTTSERVITTTIHTPSGVPISIGGLRQRKTEVVIKKLPLLGDIPWLGRIFQSRIDKSSDTEIVIYLVPFLVSDVVADGSQSFELERIYFDYVKGY